MHVVWPFNPFEGRRDYCALCLHTIPMSDLRPCQHYIVNNTNNTNNIVGDGSVTSINWTFNLSQIAQQQVCKLTGLS